MDLSNLTTVELLALQKDVELTLVRKHTEQVQAARQAIIEILDKYDVPREEVLASLLAPASKFRKFQNPANPEQVWLGRGKKPDWLHALLAAGHTLEELRAS